MRLGAEEEGCRGLFERGAIAVCSRLDVRGLEAHGAPLPVDRSGLLGLLGLLELIEFAGCACVCLRKMSA
jgi:hypothetical protein